MNMDLETEKDSSKSIIDNVKFKNVNLEQLKAKEKKRKRQEEIKSKQLAEEQYNSEVQEQQYKRLMHLLHRSKFYASYIVGKINTNVEKDAKRVARRAKNAHYADENTPPQQKDKKRGGNAQKYMQMSKNVQKKIHTEKKLNLSEEEIENELVSDSTNETKETDDTVIDTPKYLNGDLRDYQKEGFKWLKVLYENGINGILADEMGLGKTIQVIALLCHLMEKRQDGPYLIIAPLSTIPNWLLEFERFAPKLPVVLFHGTQDERYWLKQKVKQTYEVTDTYSTLPIVLTSFETPLHESGFIKSLNWRYIIVDEGHRIKNYKCQLIRNTEVALKFLKVEQVLRALKMSGIADIFMKLKLFGSRLKLLKSSKSMNRLLLTGTPLQNNLSELWSLLNFLLPEIFDDLAVFESWFNAKELEHDEGTKKFLKLEEEKHVLSSLREILQPFMLRRVKADVCLEVPKKRELFVYAPLTELQHDLYKAVINRDIDTLSKMEDAPIEVTEDGKRPRRKCVLKNKKQRLYENFEREMSPSSSFQGSDESMDSEAWKQVNSQDKENLLMWKKYTNITERNRDFLINVQVRSFILYKKIVNHPYLIHCPLGPDGLPKIDEEIVRSSGKLLVLDAMLAKLKEQGHKVLLFSTMRMILDMIEDYLTLRDYKYVRLDGQTALEDRTQNIKKFNSDPEVFLFLISTRAGGVGLNLCGADTVIIYDCDWNPQADIQAMARCHRIGQTRPVMIYKLCTKGTIDEAIMNRAEAKRLLEKVVISKPVGPLKFKTKADLMELQRLMESKDCQIVKSEREVFTEEELNKLLDRSELMEKQNES